MSAKFNYYRKFIILRRDYTNIHHIKPRGHVKIEVRGNKGTLSFNLENCEQGQDYEAYLLKKRQDKTHEEKIGKIFANQEGQIRLKIPLNIRELESRGFPINKIDAILVRRGINILLAAYIDRDNGILEEFIRENLLETEELRGAEIHRDLDLAQEDAKVREEIQQPEGDGPKIIEMDEVTDLGEMTRDTQEEEDEVIETIASAPYIRQGLEEDIDPSQEEPKAPEETVHLPKSPPIDDYESQEYTRRLNYRNQMTDYILSVLKFFPQVQPLKIYLHNYNWWKIADDGIEPHRGFLPYFNYLMSSEYRYPLIEDSTSCMNQMKKHGHYLFGLYEEAEEVKYYVYGIPGRFTIEDQPFRGITGFNTWYDSTDGIGYWILYIDPIKGKVIYPINPMIPFD